MRYTKAKTVVVRPSLLCIFLRLRVVAIAKTGFICNNFWILSWEESERKEKWLHKVNKSFHCGCEKKTMEFPCKKEKSYICYGALKKCFHRRCITKDCGHFDLYIEKENPVNNNAILIKKVENRAE